MPSAKIIHVEQCPFPLKSGQDLARAKELLKLRKRERKLKRRYLRSLSASDRKSQRNALRAIQGSKAVTVCAAIDASKRLPLKRRTNPERVFEIGQELTWSAIPDEQVPVILEPKRKGGVRACCDFQLKHRAMQKAICDLAAPYLKPKPFQYEYRPGGEVAGIRVPIRDAKKAIGDGNVYGATLDVDGFYSSFEAGGVAEMLHPLAKVLRTFATGEHLNVVASSHSKVTQHIIEHYGDSYIYQARRGGPMGSALSALLGGIIVSQLKWTSALVLINWVDDFLILGPSKQAVEEAANALIALVAALPGGHFKLNLRSLRHAHDDIVFLGHRLSLNNGKIEIEPAHLDDLFNKLVELDEEVWPYAFGRKQDVPGARQLVIRKMCRMMSLTKSWHQAFSECDHSDEIAFVVFDQLRPYCARVSLSLEELDKLARETTVHKWWYS